MLYSVDFSFIPNSSAFQIDFNEPKIVHFAFPNYFICFYKPHKPTATKCQKIKTKKQEYKYCKNTKQKKSKKQSVARGFSFI